MALGAKRTSVVGMYAVVISSATEHRGTTGLALSRSNERSVLSSFYMRMDNARRNDESLCDSRLVFIFTASRWRHGPERSLYLKKNLQVHLARDIFPSASRISSHDVPPTFATYSVRPAVSVSIRSMVTSPGEMLFAPASSGLSGPRTT